MGYRWTVLAAGTAAQASASALGIGLPVLAPVLRDEYSLSVGEIGVVLATVWVGSLATLLPWGLAADRFGERVALVLGLAGSAACLAGAAYAPNFGALLGLLTLAGASGSSVNSASGRAVMQWFGSDERGLALGIRQTSVPLGGVGAVLALPGLVVVGGSELAFLFLGGLCAIGALAGAIVLRERDMADGIEPDTVGRTLRDGRLWRLSFGSSIYLYAQVAVIGFGVLFLVDEHGLSTQSAALVLGGSQVLAIVFRIGAGRWSDLVGSRVAPLRRVGIAVAAAMVLTAALTEGPVWLLVPALTLAGGLSMAWNGLAFVAAAELAGTARSGAAIGFQQTVLSGVGVAAPVLFAATVSVWGWTVAFALSAPFPLVGWWFLRPLAERR